MRILLLTLTLLAGAAAADAGLDDCRQRVVDYAHFWDHQDAAGLAELFTDAGCRIAERRLVPVMRSEGGA